MTPRAEQEHDECRSSERGSDDADRKLAPRDDAARDGVADDEERGARDERKRQ